MADGTVPPSSGRAAAQAAELALDATTAQVLRTHLPGVAETVVAAIIDEVPPYSQPFQGRMGRVIEQAVHTSLDSFLDAATLASPRAGTGAVSYTHLTLPTNREV